jgi:hypothetical protein
LFFAAANSAVKDLVFHLISQVRIEKGIGKFSRAFIGRVETLEAPPELDSSEEKSIAFSC